MMLSWEKFLADVHMNDAFAAGFYCLIAIFPIGIPLRILARGLEAVPRSWLSRESTTVIVTFLAWALCWLLVQVQPALNGAALASAVTAVVVGPLLKQLFSSVDALVIPPKKEGGEPSPPPPPGAP